jgi:hypothetical protein
MSNLNLVAVTPILSVEIKKTEIMDRVIERLTELKLADSKYKNSSDILLLICNLVEHLTRDKKISKKEVVLNILDTLFNPTPDEILIFDEKIEFLHSNKAIKKLSRFYLFCVGVYEYFSRSKKKG